jgi:hypothetical protein
MSTLITSVEELESYRGKVVKVSEDGGHTWKFAKLLNNPLTHFAPNHSPGYMCNMEVKKGVHCSRGLTAERFSRGLLVEPATQQEIHGKKFSCE